jgi:hypothetical protein
MAATAVIASEAKQSILPLHGELDWSPQEFGNDDMTGGKRGADGMRVKAIRITRRSSVQRHARA